LRECGKSHSSGVMSGQKRMITEEFARTTMAIALRLYRLLLIELYLSPWICSCRWARRLPKRWVLERPGARNRISCGIRQRRPFRRRKLWDGSVNVGKGLRRIQESCYISDLLFESRATGRRARFHVIGFDFGTAWAITPNNKAIRDK